MMMRTVPEVQRCKVFANSITGGFRLTFNDKKENEFTILHQPLYAL